MIQLKSPRAVALMLLITTFFVVSSTEVKAQSARSRAMGGAFIGLSDDESATYYNPAGLSQVQGTEASIHSKVNNNNAFSWNGLSFTGHIYEDSEHQSFSITDYLEHNILEEPIPRKPKYSYGIAYNEGELSEKYYENTALRGTDRKSTDLQISFGTRFPVATKMLAREQLYAGLKLSYSGVTTKYGKARQKRQAYALGLGFMYHYNDRITGGLTVDNLVQKIKNANGNTSKDDAIFSLGASMKVTEGTLVSADIFNIADSKDAVERQFRIGVEKKFTENDLTLRMGSHNGTLTLGFGMNLLPNVRVDYAYYDGANSSDDPEHYVGAHMTFD